MLAPGQPSKQHYQNVPLLYHGPDRIRHMIAEHTGDDNLTHNSVAGLIMYYPINPEAAIVQLRQTIATAIEQYPTLTPGEIRHLVERRSDPAKAIDRYVAQRALRPQADEMDNFKPEDLLASTRELLLAKVLSFRVLSRDTEALGQAESAGREAVTVMDILARADGIDPAEPDYELLRAGFQTLAGRLAVASYRGWRQGLLPASLVRSPAEFRKEVYAISLAEYLANQAMLASSITKVSVEQNPLLYLASDRVKGLVAANPDILPAVLRRIIARDHAVPAQAVQDYRARVEEILGDHPNVSRAKAEMLATYVRHAEIQPINEGKPLRPRRRLNATSKPGRKPRGPSEPRKTPEERPTRAPAATSGKTSPKRAETTAGKVSFALQIGDKTQQSPAYTPEEFAGLHPMLKYLIANGQPLEAQPSEEDRKARLNRLVNRQPPGKEPLSGKQLEALVATLQQEALADGYVQLAEGTPRLTKAALTIIEKRTGKFPGVF